MRVYKGINNKKRLRILLQRINKKKLSDTTGIPLERIYAFNDGRTSIKVKEVYLICRYIDQYITDLSDEVDAIARDIDE